MPSIVPGLEYDIFISYRHNDNRSGWVTEFVKALQEELAATIKEPLSIYFDRNPHDGLLETHDVDKSLKGKLKCLIFIPILSQTYCDPKSFAWQHEFVAFNKMAKEDQFGRDVKLGKGNVASRILPIKIHDLDADDKSIIENQIGGALRAIEFIFKSAGVNRSLTPSDKREENLNKTFYRDQINKTANAIKELIGALKNPTIQTQQSERQATQSPQASRLKSKLILSGVIIFLVLSSGYFLYPKFTSHSASTEVADKSIAVLPFVNMSNDPEQEYFSDGISEEVLNLLAKVPELKVIGRTSSFYFKGKNEDLRTIGEKLGAAHLLEGSVRKEGDKVRITAQLIRSSDGTHLWSETYDREMKNIFQLQDEIATNVLVQLKLKLLGTSVPYQSRNEEVHKLLMKGRYFFNNSQEFKALDFYEQAVKIDSTDVLAWTSLSQVNAIIGNRNFAQFNQRFAQVKYCVQKALALDNNFSDAHRALGIVYFFYDFNWEGARREFEIAIQLDPNNSDAYRNLAQLEMALGENDNAVVHLQKSIDLNPLNFVTLMNLSRYYIFKGDYQKAEQIIKDATALNPIQGNVDLVYLYIVSNQLDRAQQLMTELPPTVTDSEKGRMRAMLEYQRGHKTEALQLLKQTLNKEESGSFMIGRTFAFLGDPDAAFQWLNTAHEEKYQMTQIKWNPYLKTVRKDERYIELLRKMNLPID